MCCFCCSIQFFYLTSIQKVKFEVKEKQIVAKSKSQCLALIATNKNLAKNSNKPCVFEHNMKNQSNGRDEREMRKKYCQSTKIQKEEQLLKGKSTNMMVHHSDVKGDQLNIQVSMEMAFLKKCLSWMEIHMRTSSNTLTSIVITSFYAPNHNNKMESSKKVSSKKRRAREGAWVVVFEMTTSMCLDSTKSTKNRGSIILENVANFDLLIKKQIDTLSTKAQKHNEIAKTARNPANSNKPLKLELLR